MNVGSLFQETSFRKHQILQTESFFFNEWMVSHKTNKLTNLGIITLFTIFPVSGKTLWSWLQQYSFKSTIPVQENKYVIQSSIEAGQHKKSVTDTQRDKQTGDTNIVFQFYASDLDLKP